MIKRTTYEYDIKHTGDEMDRCEILSMLHQLKTMVEDAGLAGVEINSVKRDLIDVKIERVDSP